MAKDQDPRREIDWATAQVRSGDLRVALTGPESAQWGKRLESVLSRLGRGNQGWGEIDVTKKRIDVASVTPGAEANLRHFLESAVAQANADLASPESAHDGAEDGDSGASQEDREMTDAFQGFGEPAPPAQDTPREGSGGEGASPSRSAPPAD